MHTDTHTHRHTHTDTHVTHIHTHTHRHTHIHTDTHTNTHATTHTHTPYADTHTHTPHTHRHTHRYTNAYTTHSHTHTHRYTHAYTTHTHTHTHTHTLTQASTSLGILFLLSNCARFGYAMKGGLLSPPSIWLPMCNTVSALYDGGDLSRPVFHLPAFKSIFRSSFCEQKNLHRSKVDLLLYFHLTSNQYYACARPRPHRERMQTKVHSVCESYQFSNTSSERHKQV